MKNNDNICNKREILSFLNKYKGYIYVLIAMLGIGLLGCGNKAAGAEQEYYRLYIAAGGEHTVGIDIDGTLWSWGNNGSGQLGDGTAGLTANKSTPVRVQKINNAMKWKAVAAGKFHTVGIDSNGTLWSWGANGNGQLGDGTAGLTANKSTPVRVQQKTEEGGFVDNTTKWETVVVWGSHTVAIDSDGNMWSWGKNSYGQLGDGTTASKITPVRVQQKTETGTFVDNRTKWKAVVAGFNHTVGIDIDGTLWSWGKE